MESEQDKDMAIPIKVAPPDVILFILKCSPTHSTENFCFTYALWIEMHGSKVCGWH